jgi:TolB protein
LASDYATGWSPDGTKILFFSDRDLAYQNYDIYVMSVDGSGVVRLTSNPNEDVRDNWWPSWSPDGSKIAYGSNKDSLYWTDIYVMNADGSGQTRLTDNSAGYSDQPNWSPDGSRIAFESSRDGNHEIYVMNADGSGQTNLTNNPRTDDSPDWSPDGSQIIFSSNRDGSSPDWIKGIYVMNADGSGVTRLTNDGDYWPDW